METNLGLLGKVSESGAMNSETVGVLSNVIGKGKFEIPTKALTNGRRRMVGYLTTEDAKRYKVVLSPAITTDLRDHKLGRRDLGWCILNLCDLKGEDGTVNKVLMLSYPEGTGTVFTIDGADMRTTDERTPAEFDDSLLAL